MSCPVLCDHMSSYLNFKQLGKKNVLGGPIVLPGFCTLLSSISGVSLLGGGPIALLVTRVVLMSLNFISACSWLLHDNKGGRS